MSDSFLFLAFLSIAALAAGLIRPSIYSRLLGGFTRKKAALVFGGLFLISAALYGASVKQSADNKSGRSRSLLRGHDSIRSPDSADQPDGAAYSVVTVVDGDTIDVNIDGKVERLRLIGINTPETVDPRKPVECFGKEASNKAKELLSDQPVKLEADPSQGERDKYNRLLRHVFLADGRSFNQLMISEGYAYEDGPDFSTQDKAQAYLEAGGGSPSYNLTGLTETEMALRANPCRELNRAVADIPA